MMLTSFWCIGKFYIPSYSILFNASFIRSTHLFIIESAFGYSLWRMHYIKNIVLSIITAVAIIITVIIIVIVIIFNCYYF